MCTGSDSRQTKEQGPLPRAPAMCVTDCSHPKGVDVNFGNAMSSCFSILLLDQSRGSGPPGSRAPIVERQRLELSQGGPGGRAPSPWIDAKAFCHIEPGSSADWGGRGQQLGSATPSRMPVGGEGLLEQLEPDSDFRRSLPDGRGTVAGLVESSNSKDPERATRTPGSGSTCNLKPGA